MASHSRSGLSPHQREEFLREHGFALARGGTGSHEMWHHQALKDLAQRNHVEMPDNLKSTAHQRGWEMVLSCDPGPGLWQRLEKQAVWAQETVDRLQQLEERRTLSRRLKLEFKMAVREVKSWKHDIKAAYKAGVSLDLLPEAPLGALQKYYEGKPSTSMA